MKTLVRVLCLVSILATSAFGQRGFGMRGGFGGFRGGHGHGFKGGFGHFKGGFGHGFRGGFAFRGGFGHGFHGFRGHFGPKFIAPRAFFPRSPFFFNKPFFHKPFFHRPFGTFGFGGFWGVPVYPAYGYVGPYPYSPTPNVTVIYPSAGAAGYYEPEETDNAAAEPSSGAAEPSPSVVINEYRWGSSSNVPPPEKPLHFSIALRDSTVIDAAAYWVEGGTLHYIDKQGKQNQVAVDQVDEARTRQLNSERGIEFGLPKSG